MRVLVIPSWYPSPDAPTAGVFIQQQVRALSAIAEVSVLHVQPGRVAFEPTVTAEDGVTVVRAGIAATGLYQRYFGYRKAGLAAFDVLRRTWGTPEIVHVQALFPAALIARDLKRRHALPYVVTEHSTEYHALSSRRLVRTPGMLPLVLRPLARSASGMIAVSCYLANRLVELGLARDPMVIPNVVPASSPTPIPTTTPRVITHVSVMGPEKNLDALLRAVDQLRRTRSDFVLRLIGDGECRTALERLTAELGLGDHVVFAGRKSPDEVHSLLAQSAFTVVSSTQETFSVAAAESLMCGRPVLSTVCGGPEGFIGPDVGRLVEPNTVDALAEGLDWMLDHFTEFDPGALHDYALARFAPDVVAQRILAVYRSVLCG